MSSKKRALITGITGQDGSYLAEFLLSKGYDVHGIVRRISTYNLERIKHLYDAEDPAKCRIKLHYGDLTHPSSIADVISKVRPNEVYNLGAQSHVGASFKIPAYTADATGASVLGVLEAIRKESPSTRFYQASSSEMFGKVHETPQKETTPFHPRSPYGVAKVYGYWSTVNYRESYDMHASNGILFNHESPRRGEQFVSKKITNGLAQILSGKQNKLFLGNLDAKRDWGYAKDYVEGMWLMLQQPKADDYILATNENHSVREFVEEACRLVGIELAWKGKGLKEKGIDVNTGMTIVEIDPLYFRPLEVDTLKGDYSKARKHLGWKPKVTFKELVGIMFADDLKKYGVENKIKKHVTH